MKTLTHIYNYIIFVFILLTVSVLFILALQPITSVSADTVPADEITGWGWTDTLGWISLNCVNVYAGENNAQLTSAHCLPSPNNYGVSIDSETGQLNGSAWSSNAGWIDFNPTIGAPSIGSLPIITGGDLYNYTVHLDTETRYLEGWAVATFNDTDPNNNAWIRFRAGENCSTVSPDENSYCVRLNDHDYLAGWAWSGGNDGLGWIYFDESFSGGPYIETQYGDIYSGRNISGSRAPEGKYNATYCIVSGGVDNITLSSSQACLLGDIDIGFPDPLKEYSTSMVKIDLIMLKSMAVGNGVYVDAETTTPYTIEQIPSGNSLDGLVYYFTSSTNENVAFELNSALSFSNASGSDSLGTGTIVIDGDLYIKSNISYFPGTPSNLSDIASVAWIVLGDVYIDPSVSHVVGTFVVLGNGTLNLEDGTIRTGRFYTGEFDYVDSHYVSTPQQFNFSGMIVAKQIVLERAYFEGLAAAEIFEYDGRVLINTPLGLGNFIGYLPDWSR